MINKPSHTLWLCCMANFINAADRVIMPIAIVPMTDEFKWDMHGQGWVLSSFAVIGASATRKYGGKNMLTLSVFLWSLSTFLVPLFAHSLYNMSPPDLALDVLFVWLSRFSMGVRVNNNNVNWREFVSHWPLWSIYIAHFSMNWSNYIIMHWLPTYLTRTLGADQTHIMLTAVPYVMNSVVGVVAGHCADSLISRYKWTVFFVTICLGLSACNSSGHLSNHAEATIPGILCGPLTAELVTSSGGRWLPVFVLAAGVNFVGAIVYLSQSAASQLL
ncbi:S17A5-like protein [Mya arenaria]|uniref:S17A5-like protein n=1 Tax=Mya arenaria TaxID=6604 RepID=A0ABY7FQE2_MYAAR|nr:S17A5-like protein [Mya arenaria]